MIIYKPDLTPFQEDFNMNREYVYVFGYSHDNIHEVIDIYENEEMALDDLRHFRTHCAKTRIPSAYYVIEKELVLHVDEEDYY